MELHEKLGDRYRLADVEPPPPIKVYKPKTLTPYEEQIIIEMLFNHCKFTDIARALKRRPQFIRYYCKKKGLKLRPYVKH